MGFYNDVILPRLCHLVMGNRRLVPYRERVIGSAEGRTLEIGIGSGLNLPFYRPAVREIVGIEPALQLIAMARQVAERTRMPVTFIEESAEVIPLEDDTVDSVVTTWTLCTIPQADRALGEMRRVLKRSGRLLFVEHGLAPDVRRAQMAELVDARMEAHQRRLPFEPAYPDDDRERWLPFRSVGERLYAGSKAVRFHLRGQRSTVLSRFNNSEPFI